MKKSRYLISTVCDDNYLDGAIVLFHSIKKQLKVYDETDFNIYHHQKISPLSPESMNQLRRVIPKVRFTEVQQSKYHQVKIDYESHRLALIKLEIFREVGHFEVAVHIDSDMLCLKDFSELFELKENIAMAKCRNQISGRFNSGLIVLKKMKRDVYKDFIDRVNNSHGYMLDQPIINQMMEKLDWSIKELPQSYNYPFLMGHPDIANEDDLIQNLDGIKFLHWSGNTDKRKKPWEKAIQESLAWRLWNKQFQECQSLICEQINS